MNKKTVGVIALAAAGLGAVYLLMKSGALAGVTGVGGVVPTGQYETGGQTETGGYIFPAEASVSFPQMPYFEPMGFFKMPAGEPAGNGTKKDFILAGEGLPGYGMTYIGAIQDGQAGIRDIPKAGQIQTELTGLTISSLLGIITGGPIGFVTGASTALMQSPNLISAALPKKEAVVETGVGGFGAAGLPASSISTPAVSASMGPGTSGKSGMSGAAIRSLFILSTTKKSENVTSSSGGSAFGGSADAGYGGGGTGGR